MDKIAQPIRLETEQVSAYYDFDQRLSVVIYRGILSSEVTTLVYHWLDDVMQHVDYIRGRVFDFSQVTTFSSDNLSTAQREIRNLNVNHDLANVPAALIVETFQQEQMVDLSLHFSPRRGLKRIVHSMDQALRFIDQNRAG